ncbi:protein phosphatase 2C domain-containing protein [Rhodocytophaga aerolata]|uniref:Protein phosphatase 2C domain-containing protein n=1 Tax=Rhodocytophaga aerolata TaxID=455078 RepID=A0ABT8RGZ4_9BACT|nr:protein phosphatase 2C domain-containing protein [Rhodocytophaga aerolata]MDO1449982.1 protein phosphatase 2C domain-containing protein [Rhodocytophaga aerolata]
MNIYQLLRIGEHHINHCEDYAIVETIGQGKILCAVMDGCTMGGDSYFAATLVGKLLRKIAIEKSYQSFYDKSHNTSVDIDLKYILGKLMAELKDLKNKLLLKDDELLTTLLIAIMDVENNTGKILTIGDGLVCINGQLYEFEQDNKPDYLGYHLAEEFEMWYSKQKQILHIDKIEDISICTDGIFTFSAYDKKKYNVQKDPINYLQLIIYWLTKKIKSLKAC